MENSGIYDDDPFEDGIASYLNGHSILENPYSCTTSQYDDWIYGYMYMKNYLEEDDDH